MPYLFLILFVFYCNTLFAQTTVRLRIITSDRDSTFLSKDFSYRKTFNDTLTRTAEMKSLLRKLYQQGYLEASFTDLMYDEELLTAGLFIGTQWDWANLRYQAADEVILQKIGFREKFYNGKPFRPEEITQLLDELLTYCENNGYPFAAVRLDSFSINEQKQLNAGIYITKNDLITIDSIVVKGDASISNKYLSNYLGFRLPDIYQEDAVSAITSRLSELPFLSEERSSQIQFRDKTATIFLNLKKRNASNFDFILGVLPNSSTTGKLLVTGEGQLNLNNPFGRGETLHFSFSQLPGKSTMVNLRGAYPYLFNFPFGIDLEFDLYKDDTVYLKVMEQIGLKYLFTGENYFKFFFRNTSNSTLSIDTAVIVENKTLPENLDYRTGAYGIAFQYEKLDYRINPHRGISIRFSGEGGNRIVKENSKITSLQDPAAPEFNFSSLYDTVNDNKTQFRFEAILNKYWPLSIRSTLKTSYHGGLINSAQIYSNERFKIGGFRLLRGFDEQTIINTQYHIISTEYHFLLSRNSFLYLFFDGAFVADQTLTPATNDTPFGFGVGFNFETKGGIFGLSYALGRQQNNPIEFRAAKIHFGYVNYF